MSAASFLWHFAVPDTDDRGRWLVVHRIPGTDWWTPVLDCPSEDVAQAEAERRNPIVLPPPRVLLRPAADVCTAPGGMQ